MVGASTYKTAEESHIVTLEPIARMRVWYFRKRRYHPLYTGHVPEHHTQTVMCRLPPWSGRGYCQEVRGALEPRPKPPRDTVTGSLVEQGHPSREIPVRPRGAAHPR